MSDIVVPSVKNPLVFNSCIFSISIRLELCYNILFNNQCWTPNIVD